MASISRRLTLFIAMLAMTVFAAPMVSAARLPDSQTKGSSHSTSMTLLGSWTVHFIPSNLNGFGVNIRVPAERINGKFVPVGGTFDFIKAAGPFTSPPYAMGGALRNGQIRENILGGGMCSSVTTLFNAAARAGLTIVKRYPHSLYISRYPVGLDATVWGTPRSGQDLVFKNDTGHAIQIKSYLSGHNVIFEIWGVNDGRTVKFSDPQITDRVEAQMYLEYTDTLAAGKRKKQWDNYDSFSAVVTRTVRSASGSVLHSDTFRSHYKLLNGLTLVGRYPGDPPAGTRILASNYHH